MAKVMASHPGPAIGTMTTCTIQSANGNFCDAPASPGAPFPICQHHLVQLTRHAIQTGDAISDGTAGTPEAYWNRHVRISKANWSVVYYIDLGDGTAKIGFTTNLRRRMQSLFVDPSRLLAVERGGREQERMRHRQFAHLRIGRSERFRLTDELREHAADRKKHRPHHYKITVKMQDEIESEARKKEYLDELSMMGIA